MCVMNGICRVHVYLVMCCKHTENYHRPTTETKKKEYGIYPTYYILIRWHTRERFNKMFVSHGLAQREKMLVIISDDVFAIVKIKGTFIHFTWNALSKTLVQRKYWRRQQPKMCACTSATTFSVFEINLKKSVWNNNRTCLRCTWKCAGAH